MIISIADNEDFFRQVKIKNLPEDWRKLAFYSQLQKIGSDWCERRETLISKVPSAVIPHEYNCIINTKHPDFKKHVRLGLVQK